MLSVREVTKEDGKKYEQMVTFEEDEYPLLTVLFKKCLWLHTTQPFILQDGPLFMGDMSSGGAFPLDAILKPF